MAEGEEGERMGREEVKIDAKRTASFNDLYSLRGDLDRRRQNRLEIWRRVGARAAVTLFRHALARVSQLCVSDAS